MYIKVITLILLLLVSLNIHSQIELKSLGPQYKRLKFGVLIDNENYLIYRSKKLGTKGLYKLYKHLDDNDLSYPKTIIYMNKQGYNFPFLFALSEYKLQDKYNFQFFHSFGENRTYLDGQNPYFPKDDIDKEYNLNSQAKQLFPLLDNGKDGDVDTFIRILEMILNPENQPVLFHCHGGRHRTGMTAMAIRHLQGGWWINGEKTRKRGMNLNPAEYEYYKYNRLMFRKENIKFIREFSRDPRFIELKDEYSNYLQ